MALGQFVEGSVVVVPFLSGNAVFEPAKSQTARADHAPVEVRARQCPGVKDQVASGDGQFRHDAVRCGAEHGTGPGDVDGVARFQDAAAIMDSIVSPAPAQMGMPAGKPVSIASSSQR